MTDKLGNMKVFLFMACNSHLMNGVVLEVHQVWYSSVYMMMIRVYYEFYMERWESGPGKSGILFYVVWYIEHLGWHDYIREIWMEM